MRKVERTVIKAVLFDLDGVLIDSERLHQSIIRDFTELNNYPIPLERFHILIGSHKSLNPWDKILDGIELGCTEDEFRSTFRQYRSERLKNIKFGEMVFPDVEGALFELKSRDLQIACASSSSARYIESALAEANIRQYFDLVVSGDDFKMSKPNPEIYLFCRDCFKLRSDECLVVEDSQPGILAGKNAGMRVIARRDVNFGIDQSRADLIVNDFWGLSGTIDHIK